MQITDEIPYISLSFSLSLIHTRVITRLHSDSSLIFFLACLSFIFFFILVFRLVGEVIGVCVTQPFIAFLIDRAEAQPSFRCERAGLLLMRAARLNRLSSLLEEPSDASTDCMCGAWR